MELNENNYSQIKKKATKTEFQYQQNTTEHSLTYTKLRIETEISCK